MAFLQHRKAVVNRVSAGQTAAFKTDSAQKGVGFDDPFDCFRAGPCLQRQLGLDAFLHQCVKAELRQSHRGSRHLSASAGGCSAVPAGPRFKICGKGVSHAGDCQTNR